MNLPFPTHQNRIQGKEGNTPLYFCHRVIVTEVLPDFKVRLSIESPVSSLRGFFDGREEETKCGRHVFLVTVAAGAKAFQNPTIRILCREVHPCAMVWATP